MISFIVVFTLGTVQAFYGSTGILRFITLYPGSFFLQQDGWLKKTRISILIVKRIRKTKKGGFHMIYIVETEKTVEQAVVDLQEAVKKHNFGILHIHNLQETLRKKGVDFPNECQILEICNPQKAKEVLTDDMSMNMVLPCRISVYSEEGKTKIGMIKPRALLEVLSNSESLMKVAEEVEAITMEMIKEAK
jgi:uncharacterized protein (DUF302 family)